jgi:hypothetical protein
MGSAVPAIVAAAAAAAAACLDAASFSMSFNSYAGNRRGMLCNVLCKHSSRIHGDPPGGHSVPVQSNSTECFGVHAPLGAACTHDASSSMLLTFYKQLKPSCCGA